MKNIKKIIKNDAKEIVKNPIVIGALLIILILPSLYAVLNIQACWDIYGNTGELSFAIANNDNGTYYSNTYINIGDNLEENLKNNTDFKWIFTDEKTLREGVKNGKYYAGIILPKNLSQSISSVTTDNPESGELIYLVNVKSNPIASKLCDAGAKAVYTQMNAEIIEYINIAAYGKLGELESGLSSGASQMSQGAGQLSSGANQISQGAGQVSSGVGQVSSGASKIQEGTNQISTGSSQVSTGSKQIQDASSQLQQSVDLNQIPEGQIKELIKGSIKLANSSSQLASSSNQLASGSLSLASGSSQVAGGSNQLANGALSLAAGSTLLSNSATYALYTAAGSLSTAANSLSQITGIDKNTLGEYFYSPIKLDKNEIYPVDTFGSQLTPFYMVLSMWIGGLITSVMISLNTKSKEDEEYKPVEVYLGRGVLFTILAILQTTITLIGCFLLGVQVNNLGLFIFSSMLVAVVFMIFMYSLSSALGQVGKLASVVLLVLQLSSTGGVYPIELMDGFFQSLYPYMPMTYGITMIRESALGVLWANYLPALTYILILGLATIIIASIIKQKTGNRSKYIEKKLKESDIF